MSVGKVVVVVGLKSRTVIGHWRIDKGLASVVQIAVACIVVAFGLYRIGLDAQLCYKSVTLLQQTVEHERITHGQ